MAPYGQWPSEIVDCARRSAGACAYDHSVCRKKVSPVRFKLHAEFAACHFLGSGGDKWEPIASAHTVGDWPVPVAIPWPIDGSHGLAHHCRYISKACVVPPNLYYVSIAFSF